MTPIERAARALHKGYVADRIRMGAKPSDVPSWDDLGQDGEFLFHHQARAVISAIREPSEEMYKAGHDAAWDGADLNDGQPTIRAVFPAMIDAMLNDPLTNPG